MPDPRDHWNSLINQLGAEPPQDSPPPAAPTPAPPASSSSRSVSPSSSSAESESRKKSPRAVRPGDWDALASDLGVAVPPAPALPSTSAALPPTPAVAPPPEVTAQRPARPAGDRREERRPSRSEDRPRRSSEPTSRETAPRETASREAVREPSPGDHWNSIGSESPRSRADSIDRPARLTPRSEDSERELPRDDLDTVIPDVVDEEGRGPARDREAGESNEPTRDDRGRRRRRRGRRRRFEPEDVEETFTEEIDELTDEGRDDKPEEEEVETETEFRKPDDEPEGEERTRRRRRGRRRRREGGDEPRVRAASTERRPEERHADGDRPEMVEEEEEVRGQDDVHDDDDGDEVDESLKHEHRSIPTWQEAVGVLINANMEQRARNPGRDSRPRGGRGRRR